MNPRPKRWQRFALPLSYSRLFKKDYKTRLFYKQEFGKSSELIMNCDVSATRFYCRISWLLDSEGFIALECYYWSQEIKDSKNWGDHLRISVTTKKLNDWLRD